MVHPYRSLPPRALWHDGVAGADRHRFADLWRPRHALTRDTRIATFGSCFARHVARALREAGCTVLDAEPRPPMMPPAVAEARGYGVFAARTGNVYTARQMRELLEDAATGRVDPRLVWRRGARFVDALRPRIEPLGMGSEAEVLALRAWHLERLARTLRQAETLVLTLGLTEFWEDAEAGRALPLCPGVAGGTFDPSRHLWRQARSAEVLEELRTIRRLLERFRPGMRMLLTVSPVPLAATASADHVLLATTRAKAVLRAAVAEFVEDTPEADYFPALELATHPACATGRWWEPDWRGVTAEGVGRIMGVFLAAQGLGPALPPRPLPAEAADPEAAEDASCDEILLASVARR